MAFYESCVPDYDALMSGGIIPDGIVIASPTDKYTAAFLEAFNQQEAGPLPSRFHPLDSENNPFSSPEKIRGLTDKRTKASEVLGRLPFVNINEIEWDRQTWDSRRLVIEGDLLVPTERIISVRSFKDWQTGLDNPANAERAYTPDALGLGPGSLNAVITYAAMPRETQPKNDGSLLVIAKDGDGEYWGILDCDGSHRAGSQKLRGDSHIQVAKTVVHADENMPQIAYGVRNKYSKI